MKQIITGAAFVICSIALFITYLYLIYMPYSGPNADDPEPSMGSAMIVVGAFFMGFAGGLTILRGLRDKRMNQLGD